MLIGGMMLTVQASSLFFGSATEFSLVSAIPFSLSDSLIGFSPPTENGIANSTFPPFLTVEGGIERSSFEVPVYFRPRAVALAAAFAVLGSAGTAVAWA